MRLATGFPSVFLAVLGIFFFCNHVQATEVLIPHHEISGPNDWSDMEPRKIREADRLESPKLDGDFLQLTKRDSGNEGGWAFQINSARTEPATRYYRVHFWVNSDLVQRSVLLRLRIRPNGPGEKEKIIDVPIGSYPQAPGHIPAATAAQFVISPDDTELHLHCLLGDDQGKRVLTGNESLQIQAISIEESETPFAGIPIAERKCCLVGSCFCTNEASDSLLVDWTNDWSTPTLGFNVYKVVQGTPSFLKYALPSASSIRVDLQPPATHFQFLVKKILLTSEPVICDQFYGATTKCCRPDGDLNQAWAQPDFNQLDDPVERYGSGSPLNDRIRLQEDDDLSDPAGTKVQMWSTENPNLSLTSNAKFRAHLRWHTQQSPPEKEAKFKLSVDVGANHPISNAEVSVSSTQSVWDSVTSAVQSVNGWNFNDLTISMEYTERDPQVNAVRIDVLYVDIIPVP